MKKKNNHTKQCQCAFCKSKRGEYTGVKNPNYKTGITLKKLFCKCGSEIAYRGHATTGKCRRCSMKGKFKGRKNPNYIKGRTLQKSYCKDCNKRISYTAIRCHKCLGKVRKGKNNPNFGHLWDKVLKQKMSKNRKGKNIGNNNPNYGKPPKHGKRIKYKNVTMRSSYELIYAKWLDHCKVTWQYEIGTFDLGNTTYTPDFYLPERDRYIEVKGWWRDNAKKKYKLFKKLYPNIKISLIIKPEILRMKKDLQELGIKL